MDENQARTIEQIAVAFRDRFQLGHQIRKLLNVPAANVVQHVRAVCSVRPGDLAFCLCVVMMTGRSIAKPREPRQTLRRQKARRVPYLAKAVAKILGEIDHRDLRVLLPIYRQIVRLALPRNRLGYAFNDNLSGGSIAGR
jgi:hypothetical protein